MGLRHRLATAFFPTALERWALRRPPQPRVAVLMYHEVLPDEVAFPSWLVVKSSEFRGQMEYLAEHFDVLSLDDAASFIQSSAPGAPRAHPKAVVTFDDGYAGNFHHALPVLKSLGLPCTVYVATSKILRGGRYWYDDVICALLASDKRHLRLETSLGQIEYRGSHGTEAAKWAAIQRVLTEMKRLGKEERRTLVDTLEADHLVPELRMMSPEELQALSSDRLVTIGNHTHGHDLLDRISLEQGEISIRDAQEHLQALTSVHPLHFSYPSGHFTEEIAQQVASLGFRTAVTTESRVWTAADSTFHIPRIGIGRFDNMNLFRGKVAGLAR